MIHKKCLLIFIFFIHTCNQCETTYPEKFTIIFIHGTYGINTATVLKIFFYSIFNHKKLEKLFKKLTYMRFNKNLSEHKSICGNVPGLEMISNKTISKHIYKYAFNNFKEELSSLLNTNDILYYTFNWNGCLSHKERNEASKNLYQEIKNLKNRDHTRKIIIVAFSHGGNIALSLQEEALKNNDNHNIDLLILLATPIGSISEQNANGNFISEIINFYSLQDVYQTSDPFFNFPKRTKRTFSLITKKNIRNIDIRYLKKTNIDIRFRYFKKKITKKTTILYPDHKSFGNINFNSLLPPFLLFLPGILKKIIKKTLIHKETEYTTTYPKNYILTIDINDYNNNEYRSHSKINFKINIINS